MGIFDDDDDEPVATPGAASIERPQVADRVEIFRPTARVNPSRVPSVLDSVEKAASKVRDARQVAAARKAEVQRVARQEAETQRQFEVMERQRIIASKAEVRAERALRKAEAEAAAASQEALERREKDEATAIAWTEAMEAQRRQALEAEEAKRAALRQTRDAMAQARREESARYRRAKQASAATAASRISSRVHARWSAATVWTGVQLNAMRARKVVRRSRRALVWGCSTLGVLLLLMLLALTLVHFIRPTQGLTTSAGKPPGIMAITDRSSNVAVGDNAIALLGVQPGGQEILLLAQVQSMNAETVFLNDGNTVWAVKKAQIRGHVLVTLPSSR